MKKIMVALLSILIVLATFSGCVASISEDEARKIADSYLNDFTAKNYSAMIEDYETTSAVASQLTEDVLKKAWESTIESTGGTFEKSEFTGLSDSQGKYYFAYDVYCETAIAQVSVGVDGKGKICGLNIYNIKARSNFQFNENVTTEEVSFGKEELGYELFGTVVTPMQSVENMPGVVIIAGSGPNERYGAVGANHPYADIAQSLAENGIAVLVFDKMTYTYSNDASFSDKFNNMTIDDEVVSGAVSAYTFLKSYKGVDPSRVFIAGHSLGGYCLPMIDKALSAETPAGYIFLNAPSSPMPELMMYQIKYLSELDGISDDEQSTIDEYEKMLENINNLTSDNAKDYSAAELMNAPASYWLSLKDYDPAAAAADINAPMLFLNGTADYQVPLSEFEAYEAALRYNPMCKFVKLDNLNHLLMESNGTLSGEEYNTPSVVSTKATSEMITFIKSH